MVCWLLEGQEHKAQETKLSGSLGTGRLSPRDASCHQVRLEAGVQTSDRITRLPPAASQSLDVFRCGDLGGSPTWLDTLDMGSEWELLLPTTEKKKKSVKSECQVEPELMDWTAD